MRADVGRLLHVLLAAALLVAPSMAAVFTDGGAATAAFPSMEICISRPKDGYLYLCDRELLPLLSENTIVAGKITVIADVEGAGQVKQMAFLLDRDIVHVCRQPPYLWTWNSRTYGRGHHSLQVIATTMSDVDFSGWQNVTVLSLWRGS